MNEEKETEEIKEAKEPEPYKSKSIDDVLTKFDEATQELKKEFGDKLSGLRKDLDDLGTVVKSVLEGGKSERKERKRRAKRGQRPRIDRERRVGEAESESTDSWFD